MRILLVDDEPQILRGVSRMLEAEMDQWVIETANSGAETLDLLERETFEVVVSDMRMPEMDGAELLDRIAERYPRILRIVLSGQADRGTVLRAVRPMHQYLSKPCDPDALIEVIEKAGALQETIHTADVLDAIGRKNCLPSMPDFVLKLNRVVDDEDAGTKRVSSVLSQDASMAARVLQLANSAIFGLRYPVVELDRAIGIVGSEMIKALAMSHSVFAETSPHASDLASSIFEHSLSIAVASKAICNAMCDNPLEADTAFTGGLLHDVGKVILLNAFPDRYQKLVSGSNDHFELSGLEMEEFGATHEGIGAYALDLWGLPPAIVNIVASHHNPILCARGPISRQAVFAANVYSHDPCESDLEQAFRSTNHEQVFKDWKSRMERFDPVLRAYHACDECHV
ncbi:MAG: response regulator [Planctomycetota bacterium]